MSSELDNWEPMSDEHVASYAAMLPWEMQCNDYSGQTVWRLAVEIERLRAAGDALAATWPEEDRCGCNNKDCRAVVAAYDAWQAARRG